MKNPVQQIKNYWISDTSFITLLGMLIFMVFVLPILLEYGAISIPIMNMLFLVLYFIGIFSSRDRWMVYLASVLFIVHLVLQMIRFDDSPMGGNVVLENDDRDYAVYVYYSLASLTTVGYGDIYANGMPARMVSVMLSAIGILYPAVIIARLVTINNNSRGRE